MKYDSAIALFNELTVGRKVSCTLSFSAIDGYTLFVAADKSSAEIEMLRNLCRERNLSFHIADDYIGIG